MQIENVIAYGGFEPYVRLIWLFTIFITFLMLLLCYLYLSMNKAREREYMSIRFSNLAIEGLETERRRVSRELHDVVLPLVRDTEVSNLIRSICIDLMPPDFTRLSLKDSLSQLCANFSGRSCIECPCSIEEGMDFSFMSVENQLHLYRMVQEAFTNIEKHSKTNKASLVVRHIQRGFPAITGMENILICVSDEGIGLRDKKEENEGLGMRIIRQRAAIAGVKLDFISESGNGVMVRIEIPAGDLK